MNGDAVTAVVDMLEKLEVLNKVNGYQNKTEATPQILKGLPLT